jgi:hypothetical protein
MSITMVYYSPSLRQTLTVERYGPDDSTVTITAPGGGIISRDENLSDMVSTGFVHFAIYCSDYERVGG